MLDNGAKYFAIGYVKLIFLEDILAHSDLVLDPIPKSLMGVTHWQFEIGEHVGASKCILGSHVLVLKTNSGRHVEIGHLVVEGSS